MAEPTIICLTPVKNEAWILDNFLKSASLWADYIIIADQMSTDGSREIAQKYPKVILIDNNSETFNEPERQKILINEARKIKGQRLLITLDADEMFSPEIFHSLEWKKVLNSAPGTIIKFQWANLLPDLKKMWYGYYFPWGYMDDGVEHTGENKIHSARIPLSENHPIIEVKDFKVIHYQYVNWERMKSKHRYYQCLEVLNYPQKSTLDIFRQYHHMLAIPDEEFVQTPTTWFSGYEKREINISAFQNEKNYWFDENVLNFLEKYGPNTFKELNIWDKDWRETARYYKKQNLEVFRDPRTIVDKLIQMWLLKTQKNHNNRIVRKIDKLIKKFLSY